MTDKIIEARERALCWLKRTQSSGWCRCASADACLPTMREMFRDQVAATLAADRAAGYHEAIWRDAIEAAAKALGHLLHRAPNGVYATAVNDCHTAILALLPAPTKEDNDANG